MAEKNIAIILAAGKGIRLAPLTKKIPKPLVEINNVPILFRALECFRKIRINKCVIVVGYKAELLKGRINGRYGNKLDITYIMNKDFDATNNVYSLWLARDYLIGNNVLLMESDVIFDKEMVNLVDFKSDRSYWFADKFRKNMDGALLIADIEGKIKNIRIVREKLKQYRNNYYKSIGILLFKKTLGKKLAHWLDLEIKKGDKNIYYDLVIAKYLKGMSLFIKCIDGFKWWEIDNERDLAYAINLFKYAK